MPEYKNQESKLGNRISEIGNENSENIFSDGCAHRESERASVSKRTARDRKNKQKKIPGSIRHLVFPKWEAGTRA
jgi:hypothetical protein